MGQMPILTPRLQIAAARLIDGQQRTGRENYWAIDGDARVYEGIGYIGVVVAGPDLEAAFDGRSGRSTTTTPIRTTAPAVPATWLC